MNHRHDYKYYKPRKVIINTKRLDKYLDKIYNTRMESIDRNSQIGFIFDKDGKSLGYDIFQAILKKTTEDYFKSNG